MRYQSSPISGGGGGIRTHGCLRNNGFQDRHHRPLGHPSVVSNRVNFTTEKGFLQILLQIRQSFVILPGPVLVEDLAGHEYEAGLSSPTSNEPAFLELP